MEQLLPLMAHKQVKEGNQPLSYFLKRSREEMVTDYSPKVFKSAAASWPSPNPKSNLPAVRI